MNSKILYQNYYGQQISVQQAKSLEEYIKHLVVGTSIKKTESYMSVKGLEKKSIDYYLDPSENKNDILQSFLDNEVNLDRTLIYFGKQVSNSFELWDWEEYNSAGILIYRGKQVFDDKHRTICFHTIDLVNPSIIKDARKTYYGNQFNSEYHDQLLIFGYLPNGNLQSIMDKFENFGHIHDLTLNEYLADIEFSQIQFPWNEHPYYHSLYPLLPEGKM